MVKSKLKKKAWIEIGEEYNHTIFEVGLTGNNPIVNMIYEASEPFIIEDHHPE